MPQQSQGAYLIVNADDYGYFRCVSKGILKAARHGIVTATGVFANAMQLRRGRSQTTRLRRRGRGGPPQPHRRSSTDDRITEQPLALVGRFPGKLAMAIAILSGAVKSKHVSDEWRAQIERCLDNGLRVRFLNSHEHMHMLPSLFPVIMMLAKDYNIAHIRFPTSRLGAGSSDRLALSWHGDKSPRDDQSSPRRCFDCAISRSGNKRQARSTASGAHALAPRRG